MFRRKLKRRHLIFYLRVFDLDTSKLIGNIADITTEGVMLVSERPMDIGRMYHLSVKFPDRLEEDTEYTFHARCLWCKRDTNPSFLVSGFMLEDCGDELREEIKYLIQEIGFNE